MNGAGVRGESSSIAETGVDATLEVQRTTVIQGTGVRERDGVSGDAEEHNNLPDEKKNESQARRNGSGPLSVAISTPEVRGVPAKDEVDNDDGYTSVQVAVRILPTLEDDDDDDCIRGLLSPPQYLNHPSLAPKPPPLPPHQTLQVGGSKGPVFTFERVFGKSSRQAELYHSFVAPLVTNCLEGYNATVLACTFR
jgi:Kinesin motor domain